MFRKRFGGNKFAISIRVVTGKSVQFGLYTGKKCHLNVKPQTNQSTQCIFCTVIYSPHLTFTLIGGNEENIFVVCWMKLNGLETQMN